MVQIARRLTANNSSVSMGPVGPLISPARTVHIFRIGMLLRANRLMAHHFSGEHGVQLRGRLHPPQTIRRPKNTVLPHEDPFEIFQVFSDGQATLSLQQLSRSPFVGIAATPQKNPT